MAAKDDVNSEDDIEGLTEQLSRQAISSECDICWRNSETQTCPLCVKILNFFNLGDEDWNTALKKKLMANKLQHEFELLNSMTFLVQNNLTKNWEWIPEQNNVFRAFRETKLVDIKVVIVGEAPSPINDLHTGLAFSFEGENFRDDDRKLKSNYVIMRALQHEYGMHRSAREFWNEVRADAQKAFEPDDFRAELFNKAINDDNTEWIGDHIFYDTRNVGDLRDWTKKGVLLLNRQLTYPQSGKQPRGDIAEHWNIFTKYILQIIKDRNGKGQDEKCGVIYFGSNGFAEFETIRFKHVIQAFHPAAYRHEKKEKDKYQKLINFIKGIRKSGGRGYFMEMNQKLLAAYNFKINWIGERWQGNPINENN